MSKRVSIYHKIVLCVALVVVAALSLQTWGDPTTSKGVMPSTTPKVEAETTPH